MTPFGTKENFVQVLSVLWDRISRTPEIVRRVSGTRMVVRFHFPDIACDLYLDTRAGELSFYWDPQEPVDADVEMILASEVSHQFWLEKLNVPLALATRKIIAKGSVQKALKLLPALKPAFALYPDVLRELGYGALLSGQAKAPARRRRFLFRRTGRAHADLGAVPAFPMAFSTEQAAPPPPRDSEETREIAETDLLRTMYRIRFFEEHLATAFREGRLPTEAIHLSIGQEAVAVGVCMNLRDTDYLNTTHRGHGHMIAKGADIRRMMAEIHGRAPGQCAGKGGSMHVTDGAKSILGANGIVGAGYLLALGAGFTIQREGRDDISVVIAGDGSVNQGMFHEAANMIAVLRLPVLIVIENNGYGEFTPVERHSAVPEIHKRAAAYGIDACRIDGNDARAVYAALRGIIGKMRVDGRPRLVECMTCRWCGHMEGDPELYRSREEKERNQQQDPISRLERELCERGILEQADIAHLRSASEKEIAEAEAFAAEAPLPAPSTLLTDVYTPEAESQFTGSLERARGGGSWRHVSMAQAINEAIAEEMARDGKVFLWGEDVTLGGYFNVTEGLVERFGTARIIDTPISENAIVGGAVGAAMTGMRPIVEVLFADFLTCCMDPIVNQAAKLRYMTGGQVSIPVTIRTPVGSGVGMAAQHSQSMERFFHGVPGLMVVAPSDAYTAKGLLKASIRSNNPVLFFEHKLLYATSADIPDEDYTLPIGRARVVRAGDHVTLVAHLLGVHVALDAARLLDAAGVRAEVIDLATLYPMDTATILDSVRKTGRLATIEEGPATGGIGAEIIARVAAAGFGLLKAAPWRFAAPECPVPYAKNLENALLPEPRPIAEAILNGLRRH